MLDFNANEIEIFHIFTGIGLFDICLLCGKPMKGTAEMEEYKPAEDFVEFKKDSDINLTDATELWLIQWPLNLVTPLFPFTVFFNFYKF